MPTQTIAPGASTGRSRSRSPTAVTSPWTSACRTAAAPSAPARSSSPMSPYVSRTTASASPRMTAARGPPGVRIVASLAIARVWHGGPVRRSWRPGCRLTHRGAPVTIPRLPESTPKTLLMSGGSRGIGLAIALRPRVTVRTWCSSRRPTSPTRGCRHHPHGGRGDRGGRRARASRSSATSQRRGKSSARWRKRSRRSAASTSSSTTPARSTCPRRRDRR